MSDFHNQRVRERGVCDCPCHQSRPELCDCGLWPREYRALIERHDPLTCTTFGCSLCSRQPERNQR